MSGPVVVNNSDAYNAACLAGLGLIQVPEIGIREHLARGVLLEVLRRYRPEPMSLSLLYAHRRNLPKRVRVFMGSWIGSLRFSGTRPLRRPLLSEFVAVHWRHLRCPP
jgi:DNA-binding transcriptional LysR family regulator